MKKLLLVGSIAVVTFAYGVAVGPYQFPPFQIMLMAMQQLRLKQALEPWLATFRPGEDQIDVVMLGDSITAQGEWANILPRRRILNLGVGGDTSAGLLNRLRDVIALKPRIVLVMIGLNDFLWEEIPVDLVATHIQLI